MDKGAEDWINEQKPKWERLPKDTPESSVERIFCKAIGQLSGLYGYRIDSIKTGLSGYPDRQFILPGGRVIWVEFKKRNGRLELRQKIRKQNLEGLGHVVLVVNDVASGVVSFNENIKNAI